ncbi:hypothetical protein ACQHIV_29795 [Kribbella sp. GL6]|uniref:hypothetical protein n=1 Tax=Kribbella sp. GL6 TaxID=3419765 RepID=UPI003D07F474
MSDTSQEQSPFGRGFIAACIVIGAVVLCGVALLVGGRSRSTAAPAAEQQAAGSTSAAAAESGTPRPAHPPAPAQPTGAAQATGPAQPAGSETGDRSQGSGGCGPVAADQAVPGKAPAVDSWEVSSRIVVPRASKYGPAAIDGDGFRRCFAHSPTGAVFAAYNAYAAMADQTKVVATARRLMVPGPDTDALVRELQSDDTTSGYSVPQLAGYRIIDAGADRVSLMLATPVDTAYMSLTLTLVWQAGDWHLQPPAPGDPVGAPFAQHRDLSDFVAWSGV